MGRIVVGVDGSERSATALRWAAEEAALRQAVLDVVQAMPSEGAWVDTGGLAEPGLLSLPPDESLAAAMDEELARQVEEVLGTLPPADRLRVRGVPGPPAEALLEAAEGADLLVVGSRGRGGLGSLLLGSTSAHCVHHAPCPVVVVRTPPGS